MRKETRKESFREKRLISPLDYRGNRYYRKLNYLKRFVIERGLETALERWSIIKRRQSRADIKRIATLLKNKAVKRKILLNPGPVLTTNSVKNALIQNDICHRDSDFEALLRRLKKNSLKLFDGSAIHEVLFISGSGTAGMEAAVSSVVPKNGKLLVLINGAFGQRLKDIADLHGIQTVVIEKKWGELFSIAEVEKTLESDKKIFAIAMNHHETSVGILNPVREVGQLAKKFDKLFLVDAISSIGATPLSVRDANVDVCIASSNKGLHAFSGVALICVHKRVWEKIQDVQPRSFYLDLKKYHQYSTELHQTPYTPAVANFFALDQAVKELLDYGMEKRFSRYVKYNSFLRTELVRLGFEFLTEHGCESNAILTVKMPPGIEFKTFYDRIKKEGFIIYACKPPLAGEYFQIANMGALRLAMLYDFVFTVEKVVKDMREER